MNVAQAIVDCLEREGVQRIFGVPGEENEELLFALEESKIEFVPCRHEQGAAFIANVWGRVTGHAGVCLATLGPGATNLMTGVADANLDKAPLVAITAQGGLSRMHHESHQLLNIVEMFRPITKWNGQIQSPEVVGEVVRKAFKIAEYEKPGATHIELSEDMALQSVEPEWIDLRRRRTRRPAPDYKALRAAQELLEKAKRPLILAGNGAIRKQASKHLMEWVQKTDIPVVSTFMGKGAVSDKMDQSLMSVGMGFKDYVVQAIEASDLILAVGYDVAEFPPENWNSKKDKTIIHVDFNPAEVYEHYQPEVEIVSDVSAVLWEMNRCCEKLTFDASWYREFRQQIVKDISSYDLKEGSHLTVPGALNMVRAFLPDNGLLISDVGSHKLWVARNFPTYHPQGCIISNGLASMGIALPGGIAASLADGHRKVVTLMGDGGFLMNSQELETAKRIGAKFTIIVVNDNDYGLISWKQEQSKGKAVSTRISNPDFKAYAESFGIKAYHPTTTGELRRDLEEAIRSQELNLVAVDVDASVNGELVEKLARYFSKA